MIPALNRDGDCLSDLVLALFGSIAGAESVLLALDDELRPVVAMAEAPHGTAPSLLGKNVANPMAMLLACAAVLDHAARGDAVVAEAAAAIRRATLGAAADGIRTFDLGGEASTSEVVDEVLARLRAARRGLIASRRRGFAHRRQAGNQQRRSAQPGQGAGAPERDTGRGGPSGRRKAPRKCVLRSSHTVIRAAAQRRAKRQETAARTHDHGAQTRQRCANPSVVAAQQFLGTTKCRGIATPASRIVACGSFSGCVRRKRPLSSTGFPLHVDYLSVQAERCEEVAVLVDAPQHVIGLEAKKVGVILFGAPPHLGRADRRRHRGVGIARTE